MRCPKKMNNTKRCFLHCCKSVFPIFCWWKKEYDEYTITCLEEMNLKKQGKKDAMTGKPETREYNGEKSCYTEYIRELLCSFTNKIKVEYDENYNKDLTNLNHRILRCASEAEEKKRKAQIDIAVKQETKNSENYFTPIIETDIVNIFGTCDCVLTQYNNQANNFMSEAGRLRENYNSYFEKESTFVLEKISIYWNSFCNAYKKKYKGSTLNLEPKRSVLFFVCEVNNPASNFKVEQYMNVSVLKTERK